MSRLLPYWLTSRLRDWLYISAAIALAGLMLFVTFGPRAGRAAIIEHPTTVRMKGWALLECRHVAGRTPYQACLIHGAPHSTRSACEIEKARTSGDANGSRLDCEFIDGMVNVR